MKTVKNDLIHVLNMIKDKISKAAFPSAFAILVFALISSNPAWAGTTQPWNGGSGEWTTTTGSWTTAEPGTGDTALFNTGFGTVTISSPSTVNSILFDTGSVGAYTIGTTGGSVLALNSGGSIQTTSTVVNGETINAPITLSGSYTFVSNASTSGATLNFGGPITNSATATLTLAGSNAGTNTISGIISNGTGNTSLIKNGAGTWILSGADTYTGNTTINGGILEANGNTANVLASGKAFSFNGGTFDYNSSNANANTQTIGAVTLTTGANTVESDETSTGSGSLTIGTISRAVGSTVNLVTTGGAAIVSTPVTTLNTGVFYNGADYASAVSAGGTVGAATYVNVSAGTTGFAGTSSTFYLLQGNVSGALGSASTDGLKFDTTGNYTFTNTSSSGNLGGVLVTGGHSDVITGGAIRGNTSNGEIVLRADTAADTLTVASIFQNTTTARYTVLTKTGSGTLVLSGVNTYEGNTYINQGTLKTTSATGLGFGGGTVGSNVVGTGGSTVGTTSVAAGATLDLSSSVSSNAINEPIILSGGSIINSSATGVTTIDNGIAGISLNNLGAGTGTTAGTVSISGTGSGALATLTVNSTGSITALFQSAAGTGYTGTPTVSFNITGGTETTAPTATAVLSSIILSGAGNTIGGAGNLNINAVVSGSGGSFTKIGAGTVTLAGINTYTGGTEVQTGNLIAISTSSATGTGALLVDSGANLGGTGSIASTTNTINGNILVGQTSTSDVNTVSHLALGASTSTTFASTSKLSFNLDSTTNNQGNQLAFGTTPSVVLAGGMTLTLNLQGGAIAAGDQYTLLTGGAGGGFGGSVFSGDSGITYNATTNVISGLTLTINSAQGAGYYGDSYLMLVGDNIDVEVVPEPGTWVLMLGGLALLVFVQLRKLRS